jgi:starch synthase
VSAPRVLFATAEFAPIARVGGLAEAAAGLVRQLRADGDPVEVVVPDYSGVELADEIVTRVSVPRWAGGKATVRRGVHAEAGPLTLVATAGTARQHPYVDPAGSGWPDNDVRFFGFSAAIAALVAEQRPHVLHLNDWHTSPTLAFLETPPPAVLTIHTLGYQGIADQDWLRRLPYHREAYRWWESTNPLVGAIRLADRVIAVSPTYAREIVTPEQGMGHDHELAARGAALVGILNGIDAGEWNPATDPYIAARYRASSVARGKKACRRALIERVGLGEPAGPVGDDEPLIGVVSRLVDQKGIDLLLESIPFLARLRARLVVLGSGEAWLAGALSEAAERYVGRVAFVDGYHADLAHQIFAGADLFVMPSRFEPCGLAQMQAMAYGTLPVVTDVGGLHDTVVDADADPELGTGITAHVPSAAAITDALWRAVLLWRDKPRRTRAQRNGMAHDWSWKAPAAEHRQIYRDLTR